MSYNKKIWKNGDLITEESMNNIEDGICTAHDEIERLKNNTSTDGSGGGVDLSGYVTKETGNASQITFADGQTFQAKLDAGTLIGTKQIKPINTTFVEEIPSKNILDPTIIKTGTIFGSPGSTATTDDDSNFNYFKLEIKENSTYTVTGTSYYYYILDANDIILKKGSNSNADVSNVTITTPQNAKYLGVNFKPKTYSPETYMVVNATEMPSKYEPFGNYLKFSGKIYSEAEKYSGIVYVSASGDDSNDGLSSSKPLKTFQKAIDLGATTIIGERGTYNVQTINASNITNLSIIVDNITSSGDETSKIIIDNSETIAFTSNSNNGLYQANVTFNADSNWHKVFIAKTLTPIRTGLRSESYNCILWETCNDFTKDKKLIPVLSLDECSSTEGSFYYDGTTISLHPTDNTIDNKLYKRLIIEEGDILSFSNIQNLTLEDIEVLFPPESALYINKCSNVKVTASNFGYSSYTTNVVTDKSNVQFNYCKSYKATGDGFAPVKSGNHNFINCYGFYNYDDGLSYHDGCTGKVQGGEYYNNVKGGVAPSHGAVVSMENITSHNNGYGFYCQADRNIGRNQNLMNCVAYDNNYGISVKNYHIKTFNCKFDNNTNPTNVTVNENTSLTIEKSEQGTQGPQGPAGADGLTTAISVNGNTYTQVNGTITLPDYPEGTSSNDTNIINVKEMGAAGDGVTNDLVALKTIFQNAEDNQTIYFPEGTYLLGAGNSEQILLTLSNKNNVKIKGQSNRNTKIIAHQNTPASINMGMIALDACTNCSIEDIELDGNSQLRHVAYGGTNWGDNDSTMRNTSNIMIIGGEHVTVKNVYSHHPIMDCICIERKGGGDSPASKYIYVEDCILDYGYRQGISIVGSDYGIIKNAKITNTANALDLNVNDGVTVIGTSPKAGIDSETFIWNHHWLIDNCYFESNKGGHINMNDGASEHTIERCTFIGDSVTIEAIGSETPSDGARTLNNIVSKCDFRNCKFNTNGGSFTIVNNNFIFDDTSIRNIPIKLASTAAANKRSGACIFSNNRVSVRLDLFVKAGIELSSLNFYVSIFEKNGCIVSNNIFHNLIGPNIFGATNSDKTIITNNTFSTDQNLKDLNVGCVISSSCLVSNNIVVGNYPTAILDKLSNIVNTQKFNKEQNKYKICDSFSLYKNRKVSFKIMNFADFNTLNIKTTILERCVNDKHVPTKIEYDIVAYKKNGKLVQKCNFRNILGNDEYFVTCFGFEVVDGVLYLSFLNELDDSEIVDINIELDDINKEIDPDILDLRKIALNENIPSLYDIDVKPKQYNVGDRVRSGYRCAEMYYEVTTGGTVTSNETFDDSRDYTVNGVVFKYKGYYRTNTFGNALECSRLIVPSSLDFTSRDTKTIRTITFPVNTTDRITYASSATSIATVTNAGVVTPVSNGDAVITITCGSQTKTCNVHVSGI